VGAIVTRVSEVLARHLPQWAGGRIEPLGAGLEHTAYVVDGALVVRFGEAGSAETEARVLEAVAGLAGEIPVPRPVLAAGDCLAYPRLAGTPLIDLPPPYPAHVAVALRGLLDRLHAAPVEAMASLVGTDADAIAQWQEEAAELYPAVEPRVPAELRRRVEAFLAAPPPDAPGALVFSHNDLGSEHVLVDPATWAITGVIDWSDAAITDPAYDHGLLWRDLGVLPSDPALRERAVFYARCALLEDLAYGLDAGRERYATRALEELARVFA
jgi:aminoglycoside phosphotransferase (APT) family kinase protein